LKAGAYFVSAQVRIVIVDYLLEGKPLADKLENFNHRNPGAGHTRLAKMDVRVDLFSV